MLVKNLILKKEDTNVESNFIQPYLKNEKLVIARHNETSPFAEFYKDKSVTFGIYANRFFPIVL